MRLLRPKRSALARLSYAPIRFVLTGHLYVRRSSRLRELSVPGNHEVQESSEQTAGIPEYVSIK